MRALKGKGSVSAVAALLVLAVFAACILSVLLGGAGVYQRLTRRDQSAYESRTAVQYLATRVRQAESAPGVETFGQGDALVFRQTIDETVYVTRVYCHEGWLRELFAPEDGHLSPGDGEKLLPMERVSFSLEAGLLTARFYTADGTETSITLSPRTERGALP